MRGCEVGENGRKVDIAKKEVEGEEGTGEKDLKYNHKYTTDATDVRRSGEKIHTDDNVCEKIQVLHWC